MAIRSNGSGATGPSVSLWGKSFCVRIKARGTGGGISLSLGADIAWNNGGGKDIFLYTAGVADHQFIATPTLIPEEWYFYCQTIGASGLVSSYFGKQRPGGKTALLKDATTFTISSGSRTVYLAQFGGGGFNQDLEAANLIIGSTTWSDAEALAVAQLGITPGSSWGSGGLPATPYAFYTFATTTDLTDHSGNGRTAFTWTGTSNAADEAALANPSTLIGNIGVAGHSIARGYSDPTKGPSVALGEIRTADTVTNCGHDAATADPATGGGNDLFSNAFSDLFPNYLSSATHYNCAVVQIGTNDLKVPPITAATVLAKVAVAVNNLQAFGFAVGIDTVVPWDTVPGSAAADFITQEPERSSYNTSLRASSIGDFKIDNDAQSVFTPGGFTANPTYFRDNVHLSDRITGTYPPGPTGGYGYLARGFNTAINTWLASFAGGGSTIGSNDSAGTRQLRQNANYRMSSRSEREAQQLLRVQKRAYGFAASP